jgi:hypothetical protein
MLRNKSQNKYVDQGFRYDKNLIKKTQCEREREREGVKTTEFGILAMSCKAGGSRQESE